MAKKAPVKKKPEVKKVPTPDKKAEVAERKKLRIYNKNKILTYMKQNKGTWFRHRDFADVIGYGGAYVRPLLVELFNEKKVEKKTEKNRVNYYRFKA